MDHDGGFDSDSSSLLDLEELHDRQTEVGIDKWLRLPGEDELFKGEGRPSTKYLALRDAKLPVFDEITGWFKRNNRPPVEEVYRARVGVFPEDAELNYKAAQKKFDLDIPIQGLPRDAQDREFYDRWAETLDFRWNHDFADLRLRRSTHGWKWRLIRIRPDGSIVVSPFVKPAQKPFRERGLKSTDISRNLVAPWDILDSMRAQAQARWRGMPITEQEEKEDMRILRNLRYIEGIRNNYGFLGEMMSQMGAETGSGVLILVIGFITCYTLLFAYGPLALVPYLSEFLTSVLPLQATLRGVLTAANDAKRVPGDPYTEGNVRQWLLYWPLYQFLSFLQGWCYLVRPNWYRGVCAWRTVVCACCASPLFSDLSVHPPDYKEARTRILKRIWKERGERMAEEVIIFKAEKAKSSTKGKSPRQGRPHNGGSRFNTAEYARQLLDEARMLHGFIEETWLGGEMPARSQIVSGSSFRKAIQNLDQLMTKNDVNKIDEWELEQQKKFQEACTQLERYVGKTYAHTRSRGGAEAFRTHLKHLYGASDESVADFLKALNNERGVIWSRRNGMNKARGNLDILSQHQYMQRHEVKGKNNEILVEADKPFDDPGYTYDPEKNLEPYARQLAQKYRQAAAGDEAARTYIDQNQEAEKLHKQKLEDAGYFASMGRSMRAKSNQKNSFTPNAAFGEDMTGVINDEKRHAGMGIVQRPTEALADSLFIYRGKKP